MARRPRSFPNVSTAYPGRRGWFRVSSFQALIGVCCIAVVMIAVLCYMAEDKTSRPTGGGSLRQPGNRVVSLDKGAVRDTSMMKGDAQQGSLTANKPRTNSLANGQPEVNNVLRLSGNGEDKEVLNFEVKEKDAEMPANRNSLRGDHGNEDIPDFLVHEKETGRSPVRSSGQGDHGNEGALTGVSGDGVGEGARSSTKKSSSGQQEDDRDTGGGPQDGSEREREEAGNGSGDFHVNESPGNGQSNGAAGDDGEKAGSQEIQNVVADGIRASVDSTAEKEGGEEEERKAIGVGEPGDTAGNNKASSTSTLAVNEGVLAKEQEEKESEQGGGESGRGAAPSTKLVVDELLSAQDATGDEGLVGDGVERLVGNAGEGGVVGRAEGFSESEQRVLNELVEASIAKKEEQKCNVAFIKTHKTASTTLTSVLYRYGLRHGRRVARFDVEGTAVTLENSVNLTKKRGRPVDVFHYHHVWDGFFQSNWDDARAKFRNIMSGPDDITYVTVMREPLQHWLSYYYFFCHPHTKMEVAEFVRKERPRWTNSLRNPLAAEFGIYTEQQVDDFIERHLPTFALPMLTEELDEGLVLLGRILGWDPIDLTYSPLLATGDDTNKRWDGMPWKKAPNTSDLDEDTIRKLESMTRLDARLYEAAKQRYVEVKKLHSEGLQEAVEDFQEVQVLVLDFLNGPEGKKSPAREWYMPESDYYYYSVNKTSWEQPDYPPALPF